MPAQYNTGGRRSARELRVILKYAGSTALETNEASPLSLPTGHPSRHTKCFQRLRGQVQSDEVPHEMCPSPLDHCTSANASEINSMRSGKIGGVPRPDPLDAAPDGRGRLLRGSWDPTPPLLPSRRSGAPNCATQIHVSIGERASQCVDCCSRYIHGVKVSISTKISASAL